MRRQTLYLIGVLLILILAVQCVANAEEPIEGQQLWVLLYQYPTEDGGINKYVIDANLPNILNCWERGKLVVAQMYHRKAFYECIPLNDFQSRVIDFNEIEE